MRLTFLFLLLLTLAFFSCSEQDKQPNNTHSQSKPLFPVHALLTELTDQDYPDNPDISIRSQLDGQYSHKEVIISKNDSSFTFIFTPNNRKSDSLIVSNINLMEFIPSCPAYIQDDYTKHIGIINQEWNRQQVKYFDFEVKGKNNEQNITQRIDIARNCLNAYLWEIIAYTKEEGKFKPYYHGWFNFPEKQYAALFEQRNKLKWSDYENSLVDWIDPKNEALDLNQLRSVILEKELSFENKNNEYFPIKGERKKKERNIIIPQQHLTINDFLHDSTQFATFSPPGFYTTNAPRTTELGSLNNPYKITYAQTTSKNKIKSEGFELSVFYNDTINNRKTTLVIGGLNKKNIPTLNITDVNNGFQMPMGISNHSFYEDSKTLSSTPSKDNPYYAFLFNKSNEWIDSHKVGIDGPLLHFDPKGNLHLWILSFERHAFVGHYILKLN